MRKKNLINILPYFFVVFFIFYRSFFVFIMWQGRTTPPEPDDSYTYLYEAKKVFESKRLFSSQPGSSVTNSFSHMPFNFLLSLMSWLTSLSLEQSFHLNFYLGVILMGIALLYFLKNFIRKENLLVPLCLLILSLYNGSGFYHGFYWVVPSFYCFLFFILLFTQLFSSQKNWYLLSFLFSTLFILSHPMAIYAVFIFPAFFVFFVLLKQDFNQQIFKRTLIISTFCLFIFFLYRFLLPQLINISPKGLLGSPSNVRSELKAGREKILKAEVPTVETSYFTISLQALPIIGREYFKILFPNPCLFLLFIFGIFVIFKTKRFKMLSFYLSCLSFVLISTIHPYGYRSLLFLWPATFLLFGFFVFDTFRFFKASFSLGKSLVVAFFGFFIFYTSYFNFHWAKSMNQRKNIFWDKRCAERLLEATNKKDLILYGSKLTRAAFLYGGMIKRRTVFIGTFNYFNKDFKIFPIKFMVLGKNNNHNNTLPSETQYLLWKKCGFFNIYQIKDKSKQPAVK